MGFLDFLKPKRSGGSPEPGPRAKPDRAGAVDFDVLSREAEAGRDVALLAELWRAAFALEKWYVLARGHGGDVAIGTGRLPNGRTYVFAFTDPVKAAAFIDGPDYPASDGPANVMSIPVAAFVTGLPELRRNGVEGVCINRAPGSHAFGGPVADVIAMHEEYRRQVPDEPAAGPVPD